MKSRRAFTLIELLVVVAILALLIAILVPSLGRARGQARKTRCLANLHGVASGAFAYTGLNDGFVVPSYNMVGSGGSGAITLDGWPAILDRDGLVGGYQGVMKNSYYCPDTVDAPGAPTAASATFNPIGYQDWPVTLLAGTDNGGEADPTLPMPGFGDANGLYSHEIRSSYWINAYNPLGKASPFAPNLYYTQSVGYVYSDTTVPAQPTKASTFARPSALIMVADGIYAGQQKNTHLGDKSLRVGYRHTGKQTVPSVANAAFADGHAESIESNDFPRGSDVAPGQYTVLANQ